MRILLIEDERRLAENIIAALRETGLVVDHAEDGEAGSHLAEQGLYDAIVLDLMLPGKSGQRVLEDLRRKKLHSPVLILTAQEGNHVWFCPNRSSTRNVDTVHRDLNASMVDFHPKGSD